MTSCIFLQTEPNKIVLGTGALKRSPAPSREQISFYLNDFFLSSENPWLIPETTHIFDLTNAAQFFKENSLGIHSHVSWRPVDVAPFQAAFNEIQHLIKSGILRKAVPVLFEHGTFEATSDSLLYSLAEKLFSYLHTNLTLYGFAENGTGTIGLSPELLFAQRGTRLSTAALAGTQSSLLSDTSLRNLKDLNEHSFVIDDLREKLSTLGDVEVRETTAYNVGTLTHLRTQMHADLKGTPSFDTIVQTVHPTAALGVYPSTPEAFRFLRHDNETSPRGHFAAPIGVRFPDGNAFCIAAIRGAQWNGNEIKIGSGCGIVAESNFEAECNELRLKRESIKQKLFQRSL